MENSEKDKKYKCTVLLSAEDDCEGEIYLTKEQYEAVKYASDIRNWVNVSGGGWCGDFSIWCDDLYTGKWIKDKSKAWVTPGGDPVWICSNCGEGWHVHGIETPAKERCPDCGSFNKYEY